MNHTLAEKFQRFNTQLSEAEKATFKLVLGLAAGGLMPAFDRPADSTQARAIDTVTETLAGLQPYKKRIAKNGIAYRGRPPLISDTTLRDLQREAKALRPTAKAFRDHHLGWGGPIANQLALSRELLEFVKTYAGDVQPTGVASFIFYDKEGEGIPPHIDTDIFSLNVLLMLHHHHVSGPGSALVVFPPGGEHERVDLLPGEMVIMFAGSIAHGRIPLQRGEAVTILTFGFHPFGE